MNHERKKKEIQQELYNHFNKKLKDYYLDNKNRTYQYQS